MSWRPRHIHSRGAPSPPRAGRGIPGSAVPALYFWTATGSSSHVPETRTEPDSAGLRIPALKALPRLMVSSWVLAFISKRWSDEGVPIAWLVHREGTHVLAAIVARAQELRPRPLALPPEGPDAALLRAHGRLDDRTLALTRALAWRELIDPLLAELHASPGHRVPRGSGSSARGGRVAAEPG